MYCIGIALKFRSLESYSQELHVFLSNFFEVLHTALSGFFSLMQNTAFSDI